MALAETAGRGCPPGLSAAMNYAVFPPGARIRPRLCLAVARACGDSDPGLADAAAASIELLHCASLVHDDLPCFDDAATRRGKPALHLAFDERLALLAGDALIVLAFQILGQSAGVATRLAPVVVTVARAVAPPTGIAAGQAWECEPAVDLSLYQREKTGALFAAATSAGAAAAGAAADEWRELGERLGEAYQVADDLLDMLADPEEIGKPVGRDAALGRPNAALALGLDGACQRLERLASAAVAAIPDCPGAHELRTLVLSEARRLMPKQRGLRAA